MQMISNRLDNSIGLSITTINYERHSPLVNTSVIGCNFLISVSESESDVSRVTKPLASFLQYGLTLFIHRTHLLLNLLLQCSVDIRNEAWSKFTATHRTVVHISLSDFFVTLEASEMLARRHYWLNTEFKANRAGVICVFFDMRSCSLNSLLFRISNFDGRLCVYNSSSSTLYFFIIRVRFIKDLRHCLRPF